MKTGYSLLSILLIMLVLITTSCSKDKKDQDDFDFGIGKVSMDIDGKAWSAMASYLMTIPPEGDKEHYVVTIVATDMKIEGDDEDIKEMEGLSMFLAVPKSRFKSPIGEYKVFNTDDVGVDVDSDLPAFVWFNKVEPGTSNVQMYFPYGEGGVAGSIKVEGFKIGKQPALYGGSEGEGYTELTGTFAMDLVAIDDREGNATLGETIEITKGKFKVKAGLGFGGMFGK